MNWTESPAQTKRRSDFQSVTGMQVGKGTVAPVATRLEGAVSEPRRLNELSTAQARERWSNVKVFMQLSLE